MNKKSILFIYRGQIKTRFILNLVNNLSKYYIIKITCLDLGLPKDIEVNGEVIYIKFNPEYKFLCKLRRYWKFIFKVVDEIKTGDYDVIYVWNFKGAFLLSLLSGNKNMILQLKTEAVNSNPMKRFIYNSLRKVDILFNQFISIGGIELQERYKIKPTKTFVTSYAYDSLSDKKKEFNELNLIYLGTLTDRNIEQTIEGYNKFYREYKDIINTSYKIIGTGSEKSVKKVTNKIKQFGLGSVVQYLGYITDKNLKQYFHEANIGISYVPDTKYYNYVLVSKTYEYLLSGMPVVATNLKRNKEIITDNNGILINDNPEDFYKGLVKLYTNLKLFNSDTIRRSCDEFSWDKVILNFKKMIDHVINSKKR